MSMVIGNSRRSRPVSIHGRLANAHDKFWSIFGRMAGGPRPGIIPDAQLHPGGKVDADVCIVTYCAFPGGNAATTITELQAFEEAGLRAVIVNFSIKKSRWKWNWISERYAPFADRIISAHRLQEMTCRTVIFRGPRMMMSRNFPRVVSKIKAKKAIFVVNNSAWDEDGRQIFSWPALNARVAELGLPNSELYPTGPIIRAEADRALEGNPQRSVLSERDWPPIIQERDFEFAPRAVLKPPIVIGRHARDHPGKWLEIESGLLTVYPADSPYIQVSFLGGAETVKAWLGEVPAGWKVLPFGLEGVGSYLNELDIFVYFPSSARYEAFGRTIVEAAFSGLPIILPPRFEATFGDLAIYCTPDQVRDVIGRLAADDSGRLAHVAACRDLAANFYGTPSLIRRLENDGEAGRPTLDPERAAWRKGIMAFDRSAR